MSTSVLVESYDKIIGAGAGATILDFTGASLQGQGGQYYGIFGYSSAQTNVTVTGVTLQNCTCLALKSGWNWDVEYNEFRYNSDGADLGTGVVFKHNRSHDNKGNGITAEGGNMLIDSNEIDHNNTSLLNDGTTGAMKLFECQSCNETNYLTFSNNSVHDNYGNGIWCDHCGYGFRITGNNVENNWGCGICVEISGVNSSLPPVMSIISGNTLTNDLTHSGCNPCSPWLGGEIAINTSQNADIHDNTVVASPGQNALGLVGSSRSDGFPGGLKNILVHNNTFTVSGGSENGLVGDGPVYETQPLSMDYDTWHVDSLSAAHWAWANYPLTWQQLRATGNELTGTLIAW